MNRLRSRFRARPAITEAPAWSPSALFASSEVGAWYDPSDLTTLFQDSAGTTPVTADGQPVGRMLDKSGNGNHATQATAAARPTYRTGGGLHWLEFDGTDDWLVTGTITPGADKAQIFAGVYKASDSLGMLAETSVNAAGASGAFYVAVGEDVSARYSSLSRGDSGNISLQIATITSTGYAPDTAVLTATHDIAGDLSVIRRNGVAGNNSTADKGAGNFRAHALYIGRRAGTTFALNGRVYGLIVRFGPNLASEVIDSAEAHMAVKTGVTL